MLISLIGKQFTNAGDEGNIVNRAVAGSLTSVKTVLFQFCYYSIILTLFVVRYNVNKLPLQAII